MNKKYYKNKINKFSLKKNNKNKKKKFRSKKRTQKGGFSWGAWEGSNTSNNKIISSFYNRFEQVPFLSEMAPLQPPF